MNAIFVTGGAGFIGSNFIRFVLDQRPGIRVMNFDALTYAGNLENLRDVESHEGYEFFKGDVANGADLEAALAKGPFDAFVNFAAESHVDRAILDPGIFVRTNVLGTQCLLDQARRHGKTRFLQVSTDEVYGSLGSEGAFTESTPLAPNSPYSASKAGADLLVRAAAKTFGQDVVVTRCSNNFGPYQFPEKLIPLMITNALEDRPLPVYGDGLNVRDWLSVDDHCSALLTVLEKAAPGEIYNVGGNSEKTNIEVVRTLLRALGKSDELIRYVDDRPGHDRRYAIDSSKLQRELGWRPGHRFDEALEATVHWYLENRDWVERVRSEEYRRYYDEQYRDRLEGGRE